jgi:hypothetical protein
MVPAPVPLAGQRDVPQPNPRWRSGALEGWAAQDAQSRAAAARRRRL